MNFDPKSRISGFFDNNGSNPLSPRETTLYDQGKLSIVQVNTPGKKIPLGVEAPDQHHVPQDFKPSFKITDEQKDFFALTNLKTKNEQEFFLISLMKVNNPEALVRDVKLSRYFDKLEQGFSFIDTMKIHELAKFYAQNIQGKDISLDNFYDALHEIAVNSGDEKLSGKLLDLINERDERENLGPDAFELKSPSVNENLASNMKLDTELTPALTAEFMEIHTPQELDLFNQLRGLYNTNYLLKLTSRVEQRPQDVPALNEAAKQLNDLNQVNYINNLAKLASDLEHSDILSFEHHGPRLLKIAAAFGKKELANRIFDILPNIFLKQEN